MDIIAIRPVICCRSNTLDHGRPPWFSSALEMRRCTGRSHCILAKSDQPGRNQKGFAREMQQEALVCVGVSRKKSIKAADSRSVSLTPATRRVPPERRGVQRVPSTLRRR